MGVLFLFCFKYSVEIELENKQKVRKSDRKLDCFVF
jgi:hypothetical protein